MAKKLKMVRSTRKHTKPEYDPAKPGFKHFFENGKEDVEAWAADASEFLGHFGHYWRPLMRMKIRHFDGGETMDLVPSDRLEAFLARSWPEDNDIFFCPNVVPSIGSAKLTWYGWADTGRVNPATYVPHPVAFWETSKGKFQAIWKWERGIPSAASTCRVEALIHEYGGEL